MNSRTSTRKATIRNKSYDSLRLGESHFIVENCVIGELILSRVKSAVIRNCIILGDEDGYGISVIGGSNITIDSCYIMAKWSGIYICPGHPRTWQDEAEHRGFGWKDGNQWLRGQNLCGVLETLGDGAFVHCQGGLGVVHLHSGKVGNYGTAPYFLDEKIPPTSRTWMVKGVGKCEVIGFDSDTVTLEMGKTPDGVYQVHCYNPRYEVDNVTIKNNYFNGCYNCGIEAYFVTEFDALDNTTFGVSKDYDIGIEHGRICFVCGNRSLDNRVDHRFGMIGYAENVRSPVNSYPAHFGGHSKGWMEGVTDQYVDEVVGSEPIAPGVPIAEA